MLLGLVTPTAGHSTINGQPFHSLGNPGRVVGAVLEAQSFHPKRTARNHLRVYATAVGVSDQRADEVLHLVGLSEADSGPPGLDRTSWSGPGQLPDRFRRARALLVARVISGRHPAS
jgi:ABC-type multidrug transport system ATPase subunit